LACALGLTACSSWPAAVLPRLSIAMQKASWDKINTA
jgi:hypothetical protein